MLEDVPIPDLSSGKMPVRGPKLTFGLLPLPQPSTLVKRVTERERLQPVSCCQLDITAILFNRVFPLYSQPNVDYWWQYN